MASADAANYKARKEAFVSNLSGSFLTEINLVTLVAPVCMRPNKKLPVSTNLLPGFRSTVDCFAKASVFLHAIWTSGIPD